MSSKWTFGCSWATAVTSAPLANLTGTKRAYTPPYTTCGRDLNQATISLRTNIPSTEIMSRGSDLGPLQVLFSTLLRLESICFVYFRFALVSNILHINFNKCPDYKCILVLTRSVMCFNLWKKNRHACQNQLQLLLKRTTNTQDSFVDCRRAKKRLGQNSCRCFSLFLILFLFLSSWREAGF